MFVAGTEDALLDDSLFMHMRWLAAGNPSELHVYPGAPHNFVAMPCRAAADAHARAVAFIRRHIGCLTQSTTRTTFPVVRPVSPWACAPAASTSGKVASTWTRNAPCSTSGAMARMPA